MPTASQCFETAMEAQGRERKKYEKHINAYIEKIDESIDLCAKRGKFHFVWDYSYDAIRLQDIPNFIGWIESFYERAGFKIIHHGYGKMEINWHPTHYCFDRIITETKEDMRKTMFV